MTKGWIWLAADGERENPGERSLPRRVPPDGELLVYSGPVAASRGMSRGSRGMRVALCPFSRAGGGLVPGFREQILCRVSYGGKVVEEYGEIRCSELTVIWRVDASETLRALARRFVLDVAWMWDAPDVVTKWLETGEEGLRRHAAEAARSWKSDYLFHDKDKYDGPRCAVQAAHDCAEGAREVWPAYYASEAFFTATVAHGWDSEDPVRPQVVAQHRYRAWANETLAALG